MLRRCKRIDTLFLIMGLSLRCSFNLCGCLPVCLSVCASANYRKNKTCPSCRARTTSVAAGVRVKVCKHCGAPCGMSLLCKPYSKHCAWHGICVVRMTYRVSCAVGWFFKRVTCALPSDHQSEGRSGRA